MSDVSVFQGGQSAGKNGGHWGDRPADQTVGVLFPVRVFLPTYVWRSPRLSVVRLVLPCGVSAPPVLLDSTGRILDLCMLGQPPEHPAGQGPEPLKRLRLDAQVRASVRLGVEPKRLGGYGQVEPLDVLEAKDIVRPEGPCFSNCRLRYPDGGPKPIAGRREKRSAREHHVDQGKLQKWALVGCLQHREKEEGPDGQDGKTSLKP